MVNTSIRLARTQMKAGGVFLIEHPLTSKAWGLPQMTSLRAHPRVHEVTVDMCMYNLTTEGEGGIQAPARKATRPVSYTHLTLPTICSV